MEKFQFETDPNALRSRSPEDPAGEKWNDVGRREPYTSEEMIRDLKGILCKGRYRSWVFTQVKPRK